MLRGLLSFQDPIGILNFSWFTFFLTFVVWFNYAPFVMVIRKNLHLMVAPVKAISFCTLVLRKATKMFKESSARVFESVLWVGASYPSITVEV